MALPEKIDKDLIAFGEAIKDAISEVRKYKSENNLSMRTEMDAALIKAPAKYAEWLKETEKDFIACNHVGRVDYELS